MAGAHACAHAGALMHAAGRRARAADAAQRHPRAMHIIAATPCLRLCTYQCCASVHAAGRRARAADTA
eukprot:351282-Chlamydomonas_euryale.AAC.5